MTYVEGTLIKYDQKTEFGSIYPEFLYDYHVGAGIFGDDHMLFLTVRCFPIQYRFLDNTLLIHKTASVSITYDRPQSQPATVEEYQLVIIAPKDFSSALQPLVDHKISKGITTKLVTRNEICDSVYFPAEGRDCAEEMKYFIKNTVEQWGTEYVLLVGGRSGGILKEKWHVPVRYTNLDDGANWEGGYLSDLYFADLYDAYGNFSSWDSNGNGLFAEWNDQGKDILDMYPDIYIGRLACKNVNEVKTLLNKIITYETTTAGTEWFNRMVVVGGDSAPNAADPWYEGEEENALALQYMTGFDGVRLWTSNGNFTGPQDIIEGISTGCGFLFFDGHGNPSSWSTHPPHNQSVWITGLQLKHMPELTNAEKLPVTVCGGCHNGQFNTSLLNIAQGFLRDGFSYFQRKFYYMEWVPECWAWKLVSVKNGGSIATMAYTGLDWFATEDWNSDSIPDCVQFFSGYANTQFFKNYGVDSRTILGQAHTHALIDYLNVYPPMLEKLDCKTVQEFLTWRPQSSDRGIFLEVIEAMKNKVIICGVLLSILVTGSVPITGTSGDEPTSPVKDLVRIDITQGDVILPQDVEVVAASQGEYIDIILPRDRLSELSDNQISFTTRIADMDAYHAAFMGSYHTFPQVESIIAGIAENYSDIVNLLSIGTSYEGRSQWCLEISDNPGVGG